ncbi:MAG: pro-sigmaK processing inhibitor BofA family protein [Bacilli bacterium]|nr:pro-sigmaK processing inhibitor BofA family protein [Bacilli bacterium]
MIFIKIIINVLKRVIYSFLLLFSLNISIKSFGIIIPINIANILVTTLLGVPGLICLFLIKILMF